MRQRGVTTAEHAALLPDRDEVNVTHARPLTTTEKGLGHEHRTERLRQLAVLLDRGPRPCRRCLQLMVHPKRCPGRPDGRDGQCFHCRLDLGHDQSRVLGGQGPRDLEHARCNRRGGGQLGGLLRRAVPRTTRRW